MGLMNFTKSTTKLVAGLNIAVAIRAVRHGFGDAHEHLLAGLGAIDPLDKNSVTRGDQGGKVLLGGFEVATPAGNPLARIYADEPGYNSEIGRLAGATCGKYPDMIAVDIGANIGDTAAIIRSACPAPIVCIEGDRSLDRVLADNTAALGDVRVVSTYLDERPGEHAVDVAKEGWNSTLKPTDGGGVGVSFVTLDEVMSGDDVRRVKFLKVDVEGYEYRILRGATRILREGRPVVQFEHNREALSSLGQDETSIFRHFAEFGYRRTLFWDNTGRFLLGTRLDSDQIVQDIHDYVAFASKRLGSIYYLDVCVFHEDDEDLAAQCLAIERGHRGFNGHPRPAES